LRPHRAGWLIALCVAAIPVLPSARAEPDCGLDRCQDRRPLQERRSDCGDPSAFARGSRGDRRPGDFDFYVLALSWSPGFCATGGDTKGRDQCRRGADIGFTVHGLWPQDEHGYPSDCRGLTFAPRAALALTDGVYPAEGLARYEWRKHGTCTGLSPSAYFSAAKGARDAVTIPPGFDHPHEAQTLAPADVERAFTDANPRLRPAMVAAICRNDVLDEVRICFSKDLKGYQACPEIVRGRCRSPSIVVPPIR